MSALLHKKRLEDAPLRQKSIESHYTHSIGPSKIQHSISDLSSFQECSLLRVRLSRTCIRFTLEQDFILRSHFDFLLSSIEELFKRPVNYLPLDISSTCPLELLPMGTHQTFWCRLNSRKYRGCYEIESE